MGGIAAMRLPVRRGKATQILCLEPDNQRVGDVASKMLAMQDDFTASWLPLASSFVTRLSTDDAVGRRTDMWARRLFPLGTGSTG